MRRKPFEGLAIVGIVLAVASSLIGSGFMLLSIPFALWSALPYGLLWIVGRWIRDPWSSSGAGLAALAADVGVRAAVFIWPRGSTAAIALVFSPAYIAAIVMPAGFLIGWISGRLWRWHAAGRMLVLVADTTLLALITLGLARPELFPTTVLRRRALLERIGPPRVVTGRSQFELVQVSTRTGWFQIADLDGQPGDELAIVDHSGAEIVDSTTLAVKARVPFGGEPGRIWTSFSQLFRRDDGTFAVAETGGGFSRTRLKDLSGRELWEFRPDSNLPPNALRPADLDGDGLMEFYGAAEQFVARLDGNGREMWRRPASLAHLAATLPRRDQTPAWIVAIEYGRRAMVWNADGELLGERPARAEDSPLTAIDTFAGRSLIHGGRSARGYDLAGKLLFEVPLGDFMLAEAASVRFAGEATVDLVLVGTTDRDSRRWRLLIVDGAMQTRYDEVLDEYPRVLVAGRADGSDALFVGNASGMRVLQPSSATADAR